MAGLTAQEVAEFFLSLVDENSGEGISNLKLNKLLYYAQGCHLAIFGKPAFGERIVAWTHGPVVPTIYHKYKEYGSNGIKKPEGLKLTKYTKRMRDLLNDVYKVFGQFSAWRLRNMTHLEPPWKEAFARKPGSVITHKSLKAFFKTKITS